MVMDDFYPSGVYEVSYLRRGEPDRMITMDRVKAEAWAIQHHGTIDELYKRVKSPESCIVVQSVAPWESTDSNGTTGSEIALFVENDALGG
jgi:hypothetical protein